MASLEIVRFVRQPQYLAQTQQVTLVANSQNSQFCVGKGYVKSRRPRYARQFATSVNKSAHLFQARRTIERNPQTASPPPRSKPPSMTMSVPHGAAPVDMKSQSARSPTKAHSPPPTTNAIQSMMGKESSGMYHLQMWVAFP